MKSNEICAQAESRRHQEAIMPVIHGRYYMNPAMGAAVERARAAEEAHAPEDGANGVPPRDAHGQFVAPGAVHHVEIEVADGGYLARLHRHPQGNPESEPMHGGLPPRPSSHVFTDHNDLVEFLRNELGKQQ
jgi:hypothetical protein